MTKQNEKQQGQKRNPRPLHQTAYASALDSIAKLSSSWLASFTYDNTCLHTQHTHSKVSTIRRQQQRVLPAIEPNTDYFEFHVLCPHCLLIILWMNTVIVFGTNLTAVFNQP